MSNFVKTCTSTSFELLVTESWEAFDPPPPVVLDPCPPATGVADDVLVCIMKEGLLAVLRAVLLLEFTTAATAAPRSSFREVVEVLGMLLPLLIGAGVLGGKGESKGGDSILS
jgi:hypothetical protein